MAQARRRRTRQGGASDGLPGWAMLTIGLIIGLFVAFLIYLDDLQEPPNAAVRSTDDSGGSGSEDTGDEPGAGEDTGDKPKFEFYSILPELEVVVPDGPEGEPRRDTKDGESSTGADAPSDSGSTPGGPGTFYLQAGSFQKSEQADRMKAQISLIGLDVAIQTVTINGERWHRVRVGPYSDQESLRSAQKRLRDNDIDYLVLREKSSG